MSLGLVFGAPDGLLVVADGRNSRRGLGPRDLEPISDTVGKVAVVHGAPVAVVATGKSHLRTPRGPQLVACLIQERLDGRASEIASAPDSTREAARIVRTLLEDALQHDRALRLNVRIDQVEHIPIAKEESDQFVEVLVAGVHQERTTPPIRVTVDHDGSTMSTVHTFADRPMATVPHRPYGYLDSDMHAGMPSDLVEAHFDPETAGGDASADGEAFPHGTSAGAYALRGLSLDEVRHAVQDGLSALIEEHPASFNAYGVGGEWTFVAMRWGHDSVIWRVDLGPTMGAGTPPGL